jgi:hypothetical protein
LGNQPFKSEDNARPDMTEKRGIQLLVAFLSFKQRHRSNEKLSHNTYIQDAVSISYSYCMDSSMRNLIIANDELERMWKKEVAD